MTERLGCSPSAGITIADPSVIATLELAAEFCGRWKDEVAKIVAPLSENAEQNSNYLRLNAQRELRKCEECGERPEERFHGSFAARKEVKELSALTQKLTFRGDPVALENVIGRAWEARRVENAVVGEERIVSRADGRRYVPTTVRARVMERDGFRCAFVNEAGERC